MWTICRCLHIGLKIARGHVILSRLTTARCGVVVLCSANWHITSYSPTEMWPWIGRMQGGQGGFWRWLLEGLHTSMPSLFPPASTLPPSQDGFLRAMSLVCHQPSRQPCPGLPLLLLTGLCFSHTVLMSILDCVLRKVRDVFARRRTQCTHMFASQTCLWYLLLRGGRGGGGQFE